MVQPAVLLAPDLEKSFIVYTDASDKALGAVLLQEQNGILHPMYYASKKLNGAGKNYSTVEKECLWSFVCGRLRSVVLVENTVQLFPEARVAVYTPYCTGWLTAKCVRNPFNDLIIGNILGARRVDNPDVNWAMSMEAGQGEVIGTSDGVQPHGKDVPESSRTSSLLKEKDCSKAVSSAVQTRATTRPTQGMKGLNLPAIQLL